MKNKKSLKSLFPIARILVALRMKSGAEEKFRSLRLLGFFAFSLEFLWISSVRKYLDSLCGVDGVVLTGN